MQSFKQFTEATSPLAENYTIAKLSENWDPAGHKALLHQHGYRLSDHDDNVETYRHPEKGHLVHIYPKRKETHFVKHRKSAFGKDHDTYDAVPFRHGELASVLSRH